MGARMSAQSCGCDPGCNGGYVCERHAQLDTRIEGPTHEWRVQIARPPSSSALPDDPAERKKRPIATGVLDYFPKAIAEIAYVSWVGNEQHNPGTPIHWDRSKSADELDAMMRHYQERGTIDKDGTRHTAKMCWRALAYLEKELEQR